MSCPGDAGRLGRPDRHRATVAHRIRPSRHLTHESVPRPQARARPREVGYGVRLLTVPVFGAREGLIPGGGTGPGLVEFTPTSSRAARSDHCHRCGRPVVRCRNRLNELVAVDPDPVPGGELVINASLNIIVTVLSPREALGARRRGQPGFVPHDRVCPAMPASPSGQPHGAARHRPPGNGSQADGDNTSCRNQDPRSKQPPIS